jgi:hypothetical protein
MNRHYIYFHYKKDTNQVFYVGQGVGKRYKSIYNRSKHWNYIVNKHGLRCEIIDNNLTREEVNKLEIYYIDKFGRSDIGKGELCNKTDGGEGRSNIIITEETRVKLKLINKGRKFTQEHKDKISISNTGKKNPMTEQTKANVKIAQSKRIDMPNLLKRMSEINKKAIIGYKDGVNYEWESQKECSKSINRNRGSIRLAIIEERLCNGYILIFK